MANIKNNIIVPGMQQAQINFEETTVPSFSPTVDDLIATQANGSRCRDMTGFIAICGAGIKVPDNAL